MNLHDATEVAYKNGYAKGKADAREELLAEGYRKPSEGHWKLGFRQNGYYWVTGAFEKCSCCSYVPNQYGDYKKFNFCPNCGAKMKGGD